jgi:hypothetical protein
VTSVLFTNFSTSKGALIKPMEAQTLLLADPAQAICQWTSYVLYKFAHAMNTNSNNNDCRNVSKV